MCHLIKPRQSLMSHRSRLNIDRNLIPDQPRTPRARNPLKEDHSKDHEGRFRSTYGFAFVDLREKSLRPACACACLDGRGAAARRETKRRCAGLKGARVGLEEGRGPMRGGVKPGGVAGGEFSPRGCGEKSTPSVNCETPARPRTSSLRFAWSVIPVFWIQLGN